MADDFYTQDTAYIYIEEFPQILFTSKAGGESTNEVTQVFPGGRGAPKNVHGSPTTGQITLTKPHDPVADAPLFLWNRAWQSGIQRKLNVTVQPINAAGVPIGAPQKFRGCSRTSFRGPDFTRGTSEAATVEIVLQPEVAQ